MHHDTAVLCQRFDVIGMTCSHCEHAIAAELTRLEGVITVVADATSGTVTMEGTREVPASEVATAVDRAGYELAR